MTSCRMCGESLPVQHRRGRKLRYCTNACKQTAHRAREKRHTASRQRALRNTANPHRQEPAQWATQPAYIAAVREVLGCIELDPASSEQANTTVQASRFFDKETDGCCLTK